MVEQIEGRDLLQFQRLEQRLQNPEYKEKMVRMWFLLINLVWKYVTKLCQWGQRESDRLTQTERATDRQTAKATDRQSNRQTERQTDIATDIATEIARQTERQTHRVTVRQIARATDRQSDSERGRQTQTDRIARVFNYLVIGSNIMDVALDKSL